MIKIYGAVQTQYPQEVKFANVIVSLHRPIFGEGMINSQNKWQKKIHFAVNVKSTHGTWHTCYQQY